MEENLETMDFNKNLYTDQDIARNFMIAPESNGVDQINDRENDSK